MSVRVLPSADVDERATIGDGTTVWHLAQVRENAEIGEQLHHRPRRVRRPRRAHGRPLQAAELRPGLRAGRARGRRVRRPGRGLHQRPLPAGGRRPTGDQARRRLGAGRRDACARAPRSARARCASRRSRSAAGRSSPPVRSSSRTCPTSRSSPACPRGGCGGSARRRPARAGRPTARAPGAARRRGVATSTKPTRHSTELDALMPSDHPGGQAAHRRRGARGRRPRPAQRHDRAGARRSRRSSGSSPTELVDGRTCVAVNSGTAGQHLGLLAAGVGPGDEVIVPSFTFAATANSVALTGATPVFADIEPDTFSLVAGRRRGRRHRADRRASCPCTSTGTRRT